MNWKRYCTRCVRRTENSKIVGSEQTVWTTPKISIRLDRRGPIGYNTVSCIPIGYKSNVNTKRGKVK